MLYVDFMWQYGHLSCLVLRLISEVKVAPGTQWKLKLFRQFGQVSFEM